MRKTLLAMMLLSLTLLPGCKTIQSAVQNLTPDQLERGGVAAVSSGLRFALKKFPDRAKQIEADARAVAGIIRSNVIPVFSPTTGQVLRSTLDTVQAQIDAKTNIAFAVDILLMEIPLPKNPAAGLDEKTKSDLVALFKGIAEGIDQVYPPPAPPVPPAPPR